MQDFESALQWFQVEQNFVQSALRTVLDFQRQSDRHKIQEIDREREEIMTSANIVEILKIVEKNAGKFREFGEYCYRNQIVLKSQLFRFSVVLAWTIASKKTIISKISWQNALINLKDLFQNFEGLPSYLIRNMESFKKTNTATKNTISLQNNRLLTFQDDSFTTLLKINDIQALKRLARLVNKTQHLQYQLILQIALKELEPENYDNQLALGQTYLNLNYTELSIVCLYQLNQKHKSVLGHYYLGKGFQKLGINEKAIHQFDKANILAQQQNNKELVYECYKEMGIISLALYRIFQSAYYHQICLSIKPNSIQSCFYFSEALYFGGRYIDSYQLIRKYLEQNKKIEKDSHPILVSKLYNLLGLTSIHSKQLENPLKEALQWLDISRSYIQTFHVYDSEDTVQNTLADSYYTTPNKNLKYCVINRSRVLLTAKKYKQVAQFLEIQIEQLNIKSKCKDSLEVSFYILLGLAYFQLRKIKDLNYCLNILIKTYNQNAFNIDNMRIEFYELLHKVITSQILESTYSQFNQLLTKELQIIKRQKQQYQRIYNKRIVKHTCKVPNFVDSIIQNIKKVYQRLKISYQGASMMLIQSGEYLLSIDQYNWARQSFKLAQSMGFPPQNINFLIGKCHYKEKNNIKALAYFDKINLKEYQNVNELTLMAEVYGNNKKNKKMEECYYRILYIDPYNGTICQKVSKLNFVNQQYEEAEDYLMQSLELMEVNETSFELIQIFANLGQKEKIKIATKLQNMFFQKKISRINLIRGYLCCQNYPKAKVLLMETCQEERNQKYLKFLLQYLQKDNVNKQQGILALGNMIESIGNSVQDQGLIQTIAQVMEKYQKFQEAKNFYEKLTDNNRRNNKMKSLIKCYDKVRNHQQANNYRLIEVLLLQNELQEARNNPNNSQNSGSENQTISKLSTAFSIENISITTNKNITPVQKMIRLYELYKQLGEQREKIYSILLKIVQLKPVRLEYYYNEIIKINLQMKQKDKLKANLNKIVSVDPLSHYSFQSIVKVHKQGFLHDEISTESSKSEQLQIIFDRFIGKGKKDNQWCKIIFYAYYGQYQVVLKCFNDCMSQLDKCKQQQRKAKTFKIISALKKNQTYVDKKHYFIIMMGILYKKIQNDKLAKNCFEQLTSLYSTQKQNQNRNIQWLKSQIQTFEESLQKIMLEFVFPDQTIDYA